MSYGRHKKKIVSHDVTAYSDAVNVYHQHKVLRQINSVAAVRLTRDENAGWICQRQRLRPQIRISHVIESRLRVVESRL